MNKDVVQLIDKILFFTNIDSLNIEYYTTFTPTSLGGVYSLKSDFYFNWRRMCVSMCVSREIYNLNTKRSIATLPKFCQ